MAQIQLDDARDEDAGSSKTEEQKLCFKLRVAKFRVKADDETEGDELKAYNLDAYDDDSAEDEEKEGAGTSYNKGI